MKRLHGLCVMKVEASWCFNTVMVLKLASWGLT